MKHSTLLASAVLGALLAACGTGTTASDGPSASVPEDDAHVPVADGAARVSCAGAGPGWLPSVMTKGVHGVLTDAEASRIFQGIRSDPRTSEEAALSLFPHGVDVDWRVLHEDDTSLTIGLGRWSERGPAGQGAHVLELARQGGGWRTTGWGSCQLSPHLEDGSNWVEVAGYSAEAGSAQVTAQVKEHACTSGRNPARFLRKPRVVETSDTVTIYWTSEAPRGAQACPGNPTIDRVVELEQPLGTRVVFDGSSYPPREVRTR